MPMPGMPEDLTDAVFKLDDELRERALANWETIGEASRQEYRRYLDRAWRRRGRQERCSLAAKQLVAPDKGGGFDMGGARMVW